MKLKYKKIIILISMCTMGIGLITFSITGQSKNSSTDVEESSTNMVAFNPEAVDTIDDQAILSNTVPSISPIPTIAPEVEADDASITLKAANATDELQKNAYDDINDLIKKYLNAKLSDDIDKFKPLVNDVSILDLDDIARKTKYIQKYKNIDCYTKKGPEEGSFIVYAYHEVKFTSIKTLAPAMNEFYVKTDENGKRYIYLGKIDSQTEEYFNQVRESDEIMDLIYSVNDKMEKATNKDDELKQFYLKLEESAQSVTKKD